MRIGPYTNVETARAACRNDEVVTCESKGYFVMDIGMASMFHAHEIVSFPSVEKKDEEAGYNDRVNGYYDKWYRYNRRDNGAAYDRGCVKAVDGGLCSDEFTLIECM